MRVTLVTVPERGLMRDGKVEPRERKVQLLRGRKRPKLRIVAALRRVDPCASFGLARWPRSDERAPQERRRGLRPSTRFGAEPRGKEARRPSAILGLELSSE